MLQTEKTVPVYETEISLVVNDELYKIGVQSNWTLQYVLHDKLGLTGTKAPPELLKWHENFSLT